MAFLAGTLEIALVGNKLTLRKFKKDSNHNQELNFISAERVKE